MKRKITSILSLAVVLVLLCGACLTSCDFLSQFLQPVTKEHTLTLYDNDGTTVLHTIKVEEGKAPEKPADPTKEGYVFSGWFVTPTSSKAFDFSAPMTEDAKAYAQWKMADFQDDRDWVLSGSINGWGSNLDGYHLTRKAGTGNVYELTLDLYVDDEFQLTVLLEDGSLSYSSEGARAASSHVVAGTEYMEGAGGLGTYKNIRIKQNGNYTLSLVSDPETDNNELTIIRNGDPTGPVVEHEVAHYAIKGSKVTGWADSTDAKHLMNKGADGKFTLTIELYANDEFMFVGYEMVDGALVGLAKYIKSDMLTEDSAAEVQAKAGGNFTTSADGTYTFTFDPATEKISVSYSPEFSLEAVARPTTWYILGNGSVAGSVLNNAAWGLKDEAAQGFVDKGNGVYELTLDLYVGDAFKICSDSSWANARDFSFMVEPGENFKANGNIEVLVAGNYTLTLTVDEDETKDTITWVRNGDAAEGEEQEVVIDAFAIKGSKVTGWADSTAEEHLLKKNADGKYVLTIEMYANDEFMFVAYQYVDGVLTGLPIYIKSDMLAEGSAAEVAAKAGGNFTTSANGTYTFTYDHETKSISVAYSSDFSLEVAARPTTWYILGNGTVAGSVLNNAAWGLKDEAAQGLVSKGNGVYEITLDLYAGDEFQICSSSSWSDKHGFSSLVNPGENFTQGGNITVAVAGNYTLTLTVDPDDETKDTLTWVRNGDAGEVEETEYPADAFAIKGSKVTGWADKTDAQYLMNKNADGKFVLVIELYANDEFMFVGYEMVDDALSALALYIKSDMIAEGSAAEVQAKAGGNFTTAANGTYTFTFDPETNKVHIAYSSDFSLEVVARPTTWYILGNGQTEGSVLKTSSWGLKDESVQKLVDKGNGVYEITLNLYAGDEFQICSSGSWSDKHGFDSLVEPGENFTRGGNITVAVEGNYTLTLSIDADDETKDTITWVRNGDCE